MKCVLAHDLGTSGNKATLYSEEGVLLDSCVESYATDFFGGNCAEQNPEDWWAAVCRGTKRLMGACPNMEIAAVSFSGQMMGCLCVDKNGVPLRNHILYCDQRSTTQTEAVLKKIDPFTFYTISGHRCSPVYAIQKLMWVKENEPDIYSRTHKMLNAKDYIAFKLTGQMATDYSDAGGTAAFDIQTLDWSDEILQAAGIAREKLPDAYPSTYVVGEVGAQAAGQTGIPAGTPVVLGAGDGVAAGVGAGSVAPEGAYSCIGSSSWMALTAEKPLLDPAMRTTNWVHAVPGRYHPCASMQAAGSCYVWAEKQLGAEERQLAAAQNKTAFDVLNEEIADTPAGANGVFFLPYMMGERTPHWDPDAKGAFIGLTLSSKRADMMRAVLEGVTFNMRTMVDIYRENGMAIKDMAFVGGGARADVWRRMMADIYGVEVKIPRGLEECTSMGAAVIGGVGVGLFPDFSAVERFTRVEQTYKPDAETAAYYKTRHTVFKKLYDGLKDVFPEI